jgi:hypothetical protein
MIQETRKRLVRVLVTLLAVVVFTLLGTRSALASATTSTIAVIGAGSVSSSSLQAGTNFSFAAAQVDNDAPTGSAVLSQVGPTFPFTGTDTIQGPVQCLVVSGTTGNFVFTVTSTSNAADYPLGTQVGVVMQDNGSTNTDTFGFAPGSYNPTGIKDICSGTIFGPGRSSLSSGLIIVSSLGNKT